MEGRGHFYTAPVSRKRKYANAGTEVLYGDNAQRKTMQLVHFRVHIWRSCDRGPPEPGIGYTHV